MILLNFIKVTRAYTIGIIDHFVLPGRPRSGTTNGSPIKIECRGHFGSLSGRKLVLTWNKTQTISLRDSLYKNE